MRLDVAGCFPGMILGVSDSRSRTVKKSTGNPAGNILRSARAAEETAAEQSVRSMYDGASGNQPRYHNRGNGTEEPKAVSGESFIRHLGKTDDEGANYRLTLFYTKRRGRAQFFRDANLMRISRPDAKKANDATGFRPGLHLNVLTRYCAHLCSIAGGCCKVCMTTQYCSVLACNALNCSFVACGARTSKITRML